MGTGYKQPLFLRKQGHTTLGREREDATFHLKAPFPKTSSGISAELCSQATQLQDQVRDPGEVKGGLHVTRVLITSALPGAAS